MIRVISSVDCDCIYAKFSSRRQDPNGNFASGFLSIGAVRISVRITYLLATSSLVTESMIDDR